jgi:hypothetical protein
MPDATRKSTKPDDPPFGGGEDEAPKRDNPQEPSQDVKEPPLPETQGLDEKFPRKGVTEGGVEDAASVD